jgi:FkbM family methyltransferase
MNALVTRLLRSALAAAGLQIRRWPAPLIFHREAELRIGLEHVISHDLWRHPRQDFFFIQVGAFDGRANDPLREIVMEHGWRGILVEPQREVFRELEKNYGDQPGLVLRNVAVAGVSGPRTLYKLRTGDAALPPWAGQLASFRREVVLKHGDVIPDIASRIETETVECLTFEDLLAPVRPDHIDLLQVDAEGYDFEILKLFHGAGLRARIIGFEHKHLSRPERNACVEHLISLGYRVALDGPDAVAYRPDEP